MSKKLLSKQARSKQTLNKTRRANHQPNNTLPIISEAIDVVRYSNECRGIATHAGKTVFVRNALQGEQVQVAIEATHKRYDEAVATEIIQSSIDRVTPVCPYYGQCGGCDLQHLNPSKAPSIKQELVLEMLKRSANAIPAHIEDPILSKPTGYRRSARIGINQRQRDGALLTGFRRRQSAKLLNIDHCPVLDSRLDTLFNELHKGLADLDGIRNITEVLVSLGDIDGSLRFRLVKPASAEMKQRLIDIAQTLKLSAWIEENNHGSIPLSSNANLSFSADGETQLSFEPGDFLQVNAEINRAMIARAKEWLVADSDAILLDLFCGLGNFSLPLARHFKQVIGIEGSAEMVKRATQNAATNKISNASFFCADLSQPIKETAWHRQSKPDLVLLDPPRTGAAELLPQLLPLKPKKFLYIACNPAALARDTQTLVDAGYQLTRFCVLDMFPNTSHIESMALFEAKK